MTNLSPIPADVATAAEATGYLESHLAVRVAEATRTLLALVAALTVPGGTTELARLARDFDAKAYELVTSADEYGPAIDGEYLSRVLCESRTTAVLVALASTEGAK
ncbi:hypothetical protein [Nocardia sp. NPDC004711]